MRMLSGFFQSLFLILTLALFAACEKESSASYSQTDSDFSTEIESLRNQIEENIKAEDHESFIRNYILLLDYREQLPAGSKALLDVGWNLVHYANKMGLYTQGIELTDSMLAELEGDTSNPALKWKELLHSARAACYFELHQYEEARQSYAEMLYYQELLYPDQEHVSVINNIGMSFQQEGYLDSAMYYFRQVEDLLHQPRSTPLFGEFKNDEVFSGSVRDNIASILMQQQHYEDASLLYRENFAMYRKYPQHPQRLVNAGLQLTRAQLQMDRSIDAENTINVLDSLFRVLSYHEKREQLLDFYQICTQFNTSSGNKQNIILFQQAYISLADSMYSSEIEGNKHVSEELIQYKANQFQQELDREKSEALYNRQKAQLRFWILLLFIVFGMTGGLLLTISLRQRLRLAKKQAELKETERKLAAAHAKTVEQEKAILDVALQHKKQDLSNMALDATIKKEWAEKLDGLLSNAEQSRGHMRSLALRKLREEIRSHIHADHRISQLHHNIETLSAEFYDHLNARNPDLSKTEVRLVSFLKLRMSNDEIAMLQGISPKSVIMSRYRLKKKLGLPESADLDAFCQVL